ncbi:hypothetical protein DFA_09622 [Cavenderia fasciculata]|uniref:EGF-like domain-containing protein n=1 Tax=Cavenderia fasciculata TaxID=261658 RepID=F4Q851_CACFS|nr:uncharacterized protein DFA_09622 [Cavenderia fasciculata]EGG15951.1 hypothetical protein DFA_09622 [Cavenderia fasciculata]|eukprot:XP_004352276.1 hypothetical protein DFA_09622 [Cavenderia fasciculata]
MIDSSLFVYVLLSVPFLLTQEVNSVIFFIKQYGVLGAPTDSTICSYVNGVSRVTCDADGHITFLRFFQDSFTNVGNPDPSTVLVLPKVKTLMIHGASQVANSSINVATYIKNLPLLSQLSFETDKSITYLPATFPEGLPSLQLFDAKDNSIRSIGNFFNNSNLLRVAIVEPIESVTIDSTLNLPKLNSIEMGTGAGVLGFTFTQSSFPTLRTLTIKQNQGSTVTINHDYNDQILTLIKCTGGEGLRKSDFSTCKVTFTNPSIITNLEIGGQNSSITPPIGPDYSHLSYLAWIHANLTTFPGSFPSRLGSLTLTGNNFVTLPFVLPASLAAADFSKNYLTGTIDVDAMCANTVAGIDLSGNPNLLAINIDSCLQSINIQSTGITTVPDCYYCYLGSQYVRTDLTVPPNFVCNVTIDNSDLIVVQSGHTRITGTKLGWGTYKLYEPYIMSRGIPNRNVNIAFSSTNLTLPTTYAIKFTEDAEPPTATATFVEGGVSLLQVTTSHDTPNLTNFTIEVLKYNPVYFNHTVTINQSTPCVIINSTTTQINCFVSPPLASGVYLVDVANPYYNQTVPVTITGKDYCQQSTDYCHGNGQCNQDGQCVCNSNAYYDDCSKPYPKLSSGEFGVVNNQTVSLYGDFGPYGQLNPSIQINNTLECTVVDKSQFVINCTLANPPTPGLASVQLQVDGLDVMVRNILKLRPPPSNGGNPGGNTTTGSTSSPTTSATTTGGPTPDTPQQQCEKQTSNCYGHGVCDVNGICQCQDTYNQNDNCFTKFINTTITPNTTSPTVSFDIDGIDFQFEVVSIQELDFDSNIVKELFISNYTWIVNASTNNITTIVDYQLNTTLKNSSTTDINSILFQSVSVLSTISFSSKPRDIQFGDQQLHINANSIKLSVNVTNWQYSSNLATLRVVFRTITINDQTVEYDCNDKQIDALTYDSLSSLQYLRVIKDDIQFNGRFIDVALSDGRPTYSQTEVISLTQSTSNDEQSIALIGINLPQCQSCVLDPDFSPLLIDKSNDSGCEKSNNWRIIVGCVVGGIGAVAIAVGSIITYKKIKKFKSDSACIESKLHNIN